MQLVSLSIIHCLLDIGIGQGQAGGLVVHSDDTGCRRNAIKTIFLVENTHCHRLVVELDKEVVSCFTLIAEVVISFVSGAAGGGFLMEILHRTCFLCKRYCRNGIFHVFQHIKQRILAPLRNRHRLKFFNHLSNPKASAERVGRNVVLNLFLGEVEPCESAIGFQLIQDGDRDALYALCIIRICHIDVIAVPISIRQRKR